VPSLAGARRCQNHESPAMGANRSSLSLSHAILLRRFQASSIPKSARQVELCTTEGRGSKWGLNVRRLRTLVGSFIHLRFEFSGLLDKARHHPWISRCLGEFEKCRRLARQIFPACHCSFPRWFPARLSRASRRFVPVLKYKSELYFVSLGLRRVAALDPSILTGSPISLGPAFTS
jgi:hypothetical protein